jgi:hypothetical protein
VVTLSTLRAYVRALGGSLRVVADFGDREYRLTWQPAWECQPAVAPACSRGVTPLRRLWIQVLPMVRGR